MICNDRRDVILFVALGACLIFIWTTLIYLRGPGLFYDAEPILIDQTDEADRTFLRQAMAVEFPAPIDYAPITEVCTRHGNASTQFREGLLFSCEQQHGGVGMVRNQILKCIRYAMHAGAALVIPSMAKRNPADITDIETAREVPLEYLFDRPTFVRHLTAACPGMRLYDRAEDFPGYAQRAAPPLDLVGDQFEPHRPREGLMFPREWRRFFDEWLAAQGLRPAADAPVQVQMQQAYLEYPVHDDGNAFVSEFGKILSFREDTRAVAAKVLLELRRQFALPIDPTRAVTPGVFYGAHLRLEKDALEAWTVAEGWRFSQMDDQFEEQYQNIACAGLSVVYVASGNQTVVKLFGEYLSRRLAEDASLKREGGHADENRSLPQNVTVVTKYELLTGRDRETLDKMTFDQQGLVDFLIMMKASEFMGVAHSSFPWTVALRRHELSKYSQYANGDSDLLQDEYSVIMGMRSDYPYVDPFEYGLWP